MIELVESNAPQLERWEKNVLGVWRVGSLFQIENLGGKAGLGQEGGGRMYFDELKRFFQ